jgi:hypothetical protein
MTRLELLERVNTLNISAAPGIRYWTVTVMYNTVIWCGGLDGNSEPFTAMHDVIPGVP